MRTEQGAALFRRLAATADVVIENFRPGTLERWGLGFADLLAINPRFVMLRVSAYGQTGPKSALPGFARIAQAYAGLSYVTGQPDTPPLIAGSTTRRSHNRGDYAARKFQGIMGTRLFFGSSDRERERPPFLSDDWITHIRSDRRLEDRMTDENIIDRLFEIFTRHGVRSYQNGGVSMAEHMLQTAAAAEGAASAPHVVAAALLHDVGHFITDFAKLEDDPKHASMLEATVDRRHEKAGAVLLQPYFSSDVVEPIRLHVQAKRYLSAVEEDYVKTLAPQALHTLSLQGGPMSPEEIAVFEENPYGQTAAMLRRWDDAAVVQGLRTPDFEHYRDMLEDLLA